MRNFCVIKIGKNFKSLFRMKRQYLQTSQNLRAIVDTSARCVWKHKIRFGGIIWEKKKQKAWYSINSGEINRIGSIGLPGPPIQRQAHPDSNVPEALHVNGPGIYLGATDSSDIGGYIGIRQGTDGNLAVFGGSGKSRGIAMPTLQTYQGRNRFVRSLRMLADG